MHHATEPRRRTRLSPDARSRQLMDHAIAVFAQRGIGRAGHAEIAERAHVSVATVFNYYRSREELIDSVLGEVESFWYTLAREALGRGETAIDSLRLFFDAIVDAVYEKGDYAQIALEWAASVRDDLWPRHTQFCGRMLDLTRQTLQRGVERGEFELRMSERETMAVINSLYYPACQMIFREPQPPRDEIKAFMLNTSRLVLGL